MQVSWRQAARVVAAVVWTAALTACGGGGGGGGPEPAPDPGVAGSPYFPFSVGSRWRETENGAAFTAVVSGTQVIDGNLAGVVTSTDSDGTYDEYIVKSEAGVRAVPGPKSDEFSRQLGPVDLVRFPLRAGSSYVAVEKELPPNFDVDGDGRADALSVKIDVTTVGFERVVLPIGTFENCLHLRSVSFFTYTLSSDGQRVPVMSTVDEWFAPDVGRVKSTTVTTSSGRTESSDSTLVAYRVGDKRGSVGQAAPALTSVSPSGAAAVRADTTLVLNFSDDIDPATVSASTLRVLGPSGSAVAGAYSWANPRTLSFTPSAPWADGSHTVAVQAGITDPFGLALAPAAAAAFVVDATAPTVESLTPADNSLGMNASITVRYSEPMNRVAVLPALTLTGPQGPLPVSLGWQDDRTLSVWVLGPLVSGTYTAQLAAGAADTAGNTSNSGARWSFSIDAVGPTLVSTVPAPGADAVAVNTELRVTFDEPLAPNTVSDTSAGLYKGGVRVPTTLRVEGASVVLTPAAPLLRGVAYEIQLNNGITDASGNGLRQVVAVPFTTDSGRFALPQQLPQLDTRAISQLLLADLDGDRRADLLVVQDTGSLVGSVIRVPRLANGSLGDPEVVIQNFGLLPADFAVADFTGDGLSDIALGDMFGSPRLYAQGSNGRFTVQSLGTFSFGNYKAAIGLAGSQRTGLVDLHSGSLRLWRPNPAGGLSDPELLPTGSTARAFQLAVADIHGDGRQDVVAGALVGDFDRALVIWSQRPDAGFDVQTVATPRAPRVLFALGDLDNDGLSEVVVGDGELGLRVMRQTGAGGWQTGELISLPYGPTQLQAVDFNGDGRTDLVVKHDITPANDAVRFSVVLNRGGGTYEVVNPFDFDELPPLPSSPFLVADFTGDGRLDILVGQYLLRQRSMASPASVQPGTPKSLEAPPAARLAAPQKRGRLPLPPLRLPHGLQPSL
jgi:hypothetical protein